MRARWFYNTPEDEPTSSDAGNNPQPDNDDPGRTDTDTIPKKKAE